MEELRKQFSPLIEAQEKRAAEHEAHADILDKAIATLLDNERKNTENLTALREGLKKVVEYITKK